MLRHRVLTQAMLWIIRGLVKDYPRPCARSVAVRAHARALADKMRAHNPWGLSKISRDHPSMRAQRALLPQGISRRGIPVLRYFETIGEMYNLIKGYTKTQAVRRAGQASEDPRFPKDMCSKTLIKPS